jgi:predicted nucleotidyltransferase
MNRSSAVAQIREILAVVDADLVCAYLFGSVARDAGRSGSDLDLAILLAEAPPPTLEGLHTQLADRLSEATGHRVDLLILNRAPVDLIHRVLRDGLLLLDRNPSARIRFEVKARNEYFDLLPYLDQYRRARRREVA